MNKSFELNITGDYDKTVFYQKLPILVMFCSIIASFVLSYSYAIEVYWVLSIWIVPFILAVLIIGKTYTREKMTVEIGFIESSVIGRVYHSEIEDYKIDTENGFRKYLITLKTGRKIGVARAKTFGNKGRNDFWRFITNFEKSIQSTNP